MVEKLEKKNNLAIFEAILFAAGEPLETDKIAEAMEISNEDVITLFEQLNEEYNKRDGGLTILKLANKIQLATKKDYYPYVRVVLEIKRNTPLSQAAFEVLAVIAYNQPVTKSFIEQVRGVDCSGVVSSLCEKGLIEERGRLDLPGRPLLYGTTDSFLRCFSLSSLADLPPLPHDEENGEENDDESDEPRDKQEQEIIDDAKSIELTVERPENDEQNEHDGGSDSDINNDDNSQIKFD